MTNVAWQFDKSTEMVNGEHLVRCTFTTTDPDAGCEAKCVFVLTESAALGMRNDLSQVLGGLTIATSLGDN